MAFNVQTESKKPTLKPSPVKNPQTNAALALMVFLGVLAVYLSTMARSLSFWDAGEYITCSSILGIPHAPGNPFYIIFARFMTIMGNFLPHAQVVNFVSALFSALGAMFTYLFSVKLVKMFEEKDWAAYLVGIVAAVYTAFSFTYWMNSVEAEVYAGLAVIINAIVWLALLWVEKSEDFSHQHLLLLIVYLFFLGFGIHQTSLQIAPAILLIAVYPLVAGNIKKGNFWVRTVIYFIGLIIAYTIFMPIGKDLRIPSLHKYIVMLLCVGLIYWHMRKKVAGRVWLFAFLLIGVGLSSHLFLYLRAAHRPFINEGYPHNWQLFMDYVLRRQYGVVSFMDRRASMSYQLGHHFLRYFNWQWFEAETLSKWLHTPMQTISSLAGIITAFLGLYGLVTQYRKNKHSFYYFFALFFMASIAMVFVMNLSDKEVRDRDYFFVTAYNFWAFWMALGSLALIKEALSFKKPVGYAVMAIMLCLPVLNLASQYHVHDRSHELIALDYGLNMLNGLEENAIIFTNGDNDTFPLWYAQAVKDPKAKEFTYPATDVHPTETTKKMIETALAYKNTQCKGIRKDVTIANLSLLNTPWYIRQLRDKEGVEFNIKDEMIEGLEYYVYSNGLQFPRDAEINISNADSSQNIKVAYKAGQPMALKDLASIQIIKDNFGKRPIYFAVTVADDMGFKRYFRNEGMVDRLTGFSEAAAGNDTIDEQIDIVKIENNLNKLYSFRSIFDDRVYKDENMIRLINNYGAAYFRASEYYSQTHAYQKALNYITEGEKFLEEPQRLAPLVADLKIKTGNKQEGLKMLSDYLGQNQGSPEAYVRAALIYITNDMQDDGFNLLAELADWDPSDDVILQYIVRMARDNDATDAGVRCLEKIKAKYPSRNVDQYLRILQDVNL